MNVEGIDEAWSVSGPPALCVMFARLGAFGAPFDLVVSGINPGVNVGRSVYHSGTIGAVHQRPQRRAVGVAVSQAVDGFGVEGQGWDEMLIGQKWETAAAVAEAFVAGMVANPPAEPVRGEPERAQRRPRSARGWRHAAVGLEPPRQMSSAVLEPRAGPERRVPRAA